MKPLFLMTVLALLSISAQAESGLRVVTEHLPPYQIAQEGKLVDGTSYQIMKAAFERANLEVSFEVMPWARAYQEALTTPNTIIFSMTRSPDRENQFLWLFRLRLLKYAFYTSRATRVPKIERTDDALAYTSVAVRDSFEAESLKAMGFLPQRNLSLTYDYVQSWKMLGLGRADLTYSNKLVFDSITQLIGRKFQRHSGVIDTKGLYVAANKESDPVLIERLRQSLTELQQDPYFRPLLGLDDDEQAIARDTQ